MSLVQHLTVHLQQMYVAERDFQIYLCDLSGRVKDQMLKDAVNGEVRGMASEISDLKHCLDVLGAPLNDDMISPIVQAIRQEDQEAMGAMSQASAIDTDVHIAMTDTSFSTWEVGMYQAMLTMARASKQQEVVKTLEGLIQHEEEDLQRMQDILTALTDISYQQKAA